MWVLTTKEIECTISILPTKKILGPDDFTDKFYQISKEEKYTNTKKILEEGTFPKLTIFFFLIEVWSAHNVIFISSVHKMIWQF